MTEKFRKIVVMAARHDKSRVEYLKRGIPNLNYTSSNFLTIGVYQLKNIPDSQDDFIDLLEKREKSRGSLTEISIRNLMAYHIPMAAKTIFDDRSVEEVIDDLIMKYDGTKGVVHDHDHCVKNQENTAEAEFELDLAEKIIKEYFLSETKDNKGFTWQ